MSGERNKKWEKKCVEKMREHLDFYVKQSDPAHAYFSDIPMILLLYKKEYFNSNELDSCVLSVCVLCYKNLKMISQWNSKWIFTYKKNIIWDWPSTKFGYSW
jgi:hypothetical protein